MIREIWLKIFRDQSIIGKYCQISIIEKISGIRNAVVDGVQMNISENKIQFQPQFYFSGFER